MSGHSRNAMLCGLLALAVGLLARRTEAVVRYVDDSATGGINSGADWANAYTNLQTALTAAISGDELWVATGTYYPGTLVTSVFSLKANVALYGGFLGTEALLSARPSGTNKLSVLSGDNGTMGDDTDNSRRLILASSADGAVVDGFRLTKARKGTASQQGGGMNVSSLITVRNCVFDDNTGYEGAAIHNNSLSIYDRCMFLNNVSTHRAGAVQSYGTIGADNGPTFMNSLFVGNVCSDGANLAGGAMALYHNRPRLLNCTFSGNLSDAGDAIYASASVYVEAINCIFWDLGVGDHGGGIFVKQSSNPARFVSTQNSDVRGGFAPPTLGSALNNIAEDPLFVSEVGGNFRLTPASTCRDAGTVLAEVTKDLDDGARPFGSGYDIGAYEYGSAGPGAPPVGLAFFIHSASLAIADGTNTVPAQWHFEGIAPGATIVTTNGLGDYGFEGTPFTATSNAAQSVAETPLPVPPNGYPLPAELHANAMQVFTAIGNNTGVSANFVTNQTAGYTNLYVDFMVQANRLSTEPGTPPGTQVAGYFNSNGHMVVCHALYTNGFSAQLNRSGFGDVAWTELNHTPVDSNAWVRLTITMDYLSANVPLLYYTQEHYFRVALNGQILTSDRAYRSPTLNTDPALEGTFPIAAGAGETNMWFLCGDSGFGGGVLEPANQPNHAFFTAIAFDGAGKVDDLVVSPFPPGVTPPDTTTSTTSTSTTEETTTTSTTTTSTSESSTSESTTTTSETTSTTSSTTTSSSTTTATPDTTPPGPVVNLVATPDVSTIQLDWQNPSELDFAGVLILCRAGSAPSGTPGNGTAYTNGAAIGDASVAYAGPASNATPDALSGWLHTGLPPAGIFFYAVFAYDADANYAPGVGTSAALNVDADSDGDGMNNGDEYIAGTDPLNSGSLLSIVDASPVGPTVLSVETDEFTHVVYTQELLYANGLLLGWPSESNRHYSLYSGTNMASDFIPLATDLPATPPLNTYTSSIAGPAAQFFRVIVTDNAPE